MAEHPREVHLRLGLSGNIHPCVDVRDLVGREHHNVDDSLGGQACHIQGMGMQVVDIVTTVSTLLVCVQAPVAYYSLAIIPIR